MAEISVECSPANNGWRCHVRVSDGGGETRHEVTLSRADHDRLEAVLDAIDHRDWRRARLTEEDLEAMPDIDMNRYQVIPMERTLRQAYDNR